MPITADESSQPSLHSSVAQKLEHTALKPEAEAWDVSGWFRAGLIRQGKSSYIIAKTSILSQHMSYSVLRKDSHQRFVQVAARAYLQL